MSARAEITALQKVYIHTKIEVHTYIKKQTVKKVTLCYI